MYFPDFYLPDTYYILEGKGYQTERDACKWNALNNLIAFKLKEINLIKSDKLTLSDFESFCSDNSLVRVLSS